MSDKRTVFSVSAGEYSDYRVEALFEDRADAETTAARTGWYVEEFDLYGPGNSDVVKPRVQVHATAWIDSAGRINDNVDVRTYAVDHDEEPDHLPAVYSSRHWPERRPDGTIQMDYGRNGEYYQVKAYADDVTTAQKAVRERAAQIAAGLAEGRKPKVIY